MFSHNDMDLNDNQDRIETFNESLKSINMNTYDSDIYFNDQSFDNMKSSTKPSFQNLNNHSLSYSDLNDLNYNAHSMQEGLTDLNQLHFPPDLFDNDQDNQKHNFFQNQSHFNQFTDI